MEVNQAVNTSSDNQKPVNMEIDTPDLPSKHTDNLNDCSENTTNIDQSSVSKDGTEQHCESNYTIKLEMSNTSQNNIVDTVDTNITTGNLIELSDLGISDHLTNINEIGIDRLDANIGNVDKTNNVKMLNQSTTYSVNINKVSNSESDTNNDVEQQNMSIDNLEQSNIHQLDITSNTNKLTSSEKLNQISNPSMDLVQPAKTETMDQPMTVIENLDQTTPANNVLLSTSTGNLDQSSMNSENVVKLITLSDNLDQPEPDTENSGHEIVQPNFSTESVHLANMSNVIIDHKPTTDKLDQSCIVQVNLDQHSTNTRNLDIISSATLAILNKLGTSVEKVDQPTNQKYSEKQYSSVSQMETKEWGSKEEKVKLFGEDKGPHWHNVVNNLVTPPVIVANLPKVFKNFPIFGKPKNRADIEDFYDRQIRNFVGCDLSDAEYEELQNYCSIDNLRTGKELTVHTKIPQVGTWFQMGGVPEPMPNTGDNPDLFVLRKLKARMQRDPRNMYAKKLKYRGVRLIPMPSQEEQSGMTETVPPDLEPGKDVLYHIRVYRPFMFSSPRVKAQIRGRHSVFSCDVVVCGRQPLTALRDRLVCRNDADLRLDVSRRPHDRATTTAKDMFPSGFLFINNVFYVDNRPGCCDTSGVVRAWAAQRGMGKFPVRDMAAVTMQDINVRLAHPEVYVHQGNCEHVFLVSEIRLLNYSDPLHLSCYPCHTAVSHNQTIYCTTCAEFGAKWIVTGCDRVPFDPAFFCDVCFKQYLYKDGKKIGDFKAYAYKGNELSMLKPQS